MLGSSQKEKPQINWQEWKREIFFRAEKENKLILIYLSAVWSHNCHLMEEISFSNKEICEFIDHNFIPIRADKDKRPDIGARYNMGDWPSFTVLNQNGEILKSFTYLPSLDFKNTLSNIILNINQPQKNHPKNPQTQNNFKEKYFFLKLEPRIIEEILINLLKEFPVCQNNPVNQKLPPLSLIELCLEFYFYSQKETIRQVVFYYLKTIAESILFDPIDGGFFRYIANRSGITPHYEKILEDNARLVRLYLDAAIILNFPEFNQTAKQILQYLDSFLGNKEGGYGNSQNAQRDYYLLNAKERKKNSIPLVDKTIYTHANAIMISTLFRAAILLKNDHYKLCAIKTIDFLIHHCRNAQTGGMYHYNDGEPKEYGLLIDQSLMLSALIEAYQHTNIRKYLEIAEQIGEFILKSLSSTNKGNLLDCIPSENYLEKLKENIFCLREQSIVSSSCIILSYITGKEHYRANAKKMLTSLLSDYGEEKFSTADYALSVSKYIHEPLIITIIGALKRKEDKDLVGKALSTYHPFKIIKYQGSEHDSGHSHQFVAAHISWGPNYNKMVKSSEELEAFCKSINGQ